MSNKIVGKRSSVVQIEEWYRIIGKHQYKFNVTRWPGINEVTISAYCRQVGKGYVQIHLWRVKDGNIRGTYRRSNR